MHLSSVDLYVAVGWNARLMLNRNSSALLRQLPCASCENLNFMALGWFLVHGSKSRGGNLSLAHGGEQF